MSFLLWSGRAIGLRRALVGSVLAAACLGGAYVVVPSTGLASPRPFALAFLLFVLGLAVLAWSAAMAHVSVQVSAYNVRIRHGLLPMPPISVPIRMVREMRVTDVQATFAQRSGWSWLRGRDRAVIVRSGPALALGFGPGRRLVVSVDEPETAIAAFNRVRAPAS